MKIEGDALSRIKAADVLVARSERSVEIDRRIAELSEDDPLRVELERQKAMFGDLGDLPPGHPLIQNLLAAERRYGEIVDAEEEESKAQDVRKAKRVEKRQTESNERDRQDRAIDSRVDVSKNLNAKLEDALRSLAALHATLNESRDELSNDQYLKARVLQMDRLLSASRKGLEGLRISTARVRNG